jgi:hypothetical protein
VQPILDVIAQLAVWVQDRAVAMNGFFHLHDLAIWLNTTPFRRWVNGITAGNLYALPLIQWVHIMGIAVICGSVVLISLRMMGFLRFSPPLADMARRLLPWTWLAIVLNVLTGIFMVVDRPTRGLDAISFPFKILFLLFATVLSIYFAITLWRDREYWDKSGTRRVVARALGTVSFLLWIGVIIGGRWIFYSRIPTCTPRLLAAAVACVGGPANG